MKPNETQLKTIKAHLLKFKTISSWEAIKKYRITRLSAYILVLRNQGFNIISQWNVNKKSRFVVYTLKK